jgi:26S proteasome regulatory subunit T1
MYTVSRLLVGARSRPFSRHAPKPTSPQVTKLLEKYVSHTPHPLPLSSLLSFGRLLTPESVLASVSYVLSELPIRLAARVRSLEALPFIVGTNPYIANALNAYRESFQWLATYPAVKNLEENEAFASQLEGLVQSHANDIPTMAKGYSRFISLIVYR